MKLTSNAFGENEAIPSRYTVDGEDVSPPLQWTDPPKETQSFALICDDPDAPAGTWVHWVTWNIPAEERTLPEGGKGNSEGKNDFGKSGYGGPAPPSGTHRYFFKLYALDTTLNLPDTTTKADLESAMKGHVLSDAQFMGTYSR